MYSATDEYEDFSPLSLSKLFINCCVGSGFPFASTLSTSTEDALAFDGLLAIRPVWLMPYPINLINGSSNGSRVQDILFVSLDSDTEILSF